MENDTKKLGNLGEKIACEYLVSKGFKILGINWRIQLGEIDIIAKRRLKMLDFFKIKFLDQNSKIIHFIEVKTLANNGNNFSPEERVNFKKQNKLRTLCPLWLSKNKLPQNHPYQIDVIGISIDKDCNNPKISYFENVVEDA